MDWIDDVVKAVAELDYTSPEGQPNVMLLTADELRRILIEHASGADSSGGKAGGGSDPVIGLIKGLRDAIAMLMLAIARAERDHPGATIKLMLAAEESDGSGHIAARLDNADFIRDVAHLVGYEEPTPADHAAFFLASHNLTVQQQPNTGNEGREASHSI